MKRKAGIKGEKQRVKERMTGTWTESKENKNAERTQVPELKENRRQEKILKW